MVSASTSSSPCWYLIAFFPTALRRSSYLREIYMKSKQHTNCTDVCLSQKVRDVMGLHLEHFSVIKRPVGEMEAIKAESCSILQSF